MSEVLPIDKIYQAAEIRDFIQFPSERNIIYEIDQLKPNHHLFELDPMEGLAQPAEVIKTDVVIMLNKSIRARQEIKTKPGCVYIPSLNAENAIRKFKNKFAKREATK